MKIAKIKLKAVAMAVAMALCMLVPARLGGQGLFNGQFGNSGGGVSSQQFGSSGDGGVSSQSFGSSGDGGVSNQNFGKDKVSLGSGLLIMLAAGAGYAVLRRKITVKS